MKKQSIIAIIIITSLTMMNVPFESISANNIGIGSNGDFPYQPTDEVIVKALNYLKNQQLEEGSIGGLAVSSWASMAISAADEDPHNWYNLVDYLEEKSNLLDSNKVTDWERHTLAIVACDENPRDFGGVDFVEKIESFYDGVQIGDDANLYDDFFGLLSLISCGVDKDKSIIQGVASHIKGKQKENGGWGDVDSTSVAIMALIAAGESPNSEIIDHALSFIKSTQMDNGGFQAWGSANAASTSWAIDAIVAAGQNPTSCEWEKNDESPIDFLFSLQQADGSFNWTIDQSMNPEWMTSYVIPSLLGTPYPVKIRESEDANDEDDSGNDNEEDDNNEDSDDNEDNDDEGIIYLNQWSGNIRIEGKQDSIWNGVVTVSESYISAKNVDTGEIEEYHIPYPSALGAVDEAAKIEGFSYVVEYWPSWDAFLVKTIAGDSDWWHYWVDFELPMVGAGKYELTEQNDEILFGYLESWEVHALKISVDKSEVKKNEEFTVSVFDEADIGVESATVYFGSETYLTDENGNVIISCDTGGAFGIYAEKDGFIRSEKTNIKVKKSVKIARPHTNAFYLMNFKLRREMRNTWVVGAIDIEAEASDDVEKVEFYVNNKLMYTDDERPFKYKLNERAFFKRMEIMAKSYSLEAINHGALIDNIIKILEKIRLLSNKNEMKPNLNALELHFNNFETAVFKEGDTDTREFFMINLFPTLHK